jgi:lysophospholipase L1-like esterase
MPPSDFPAGGYVSDYVGFWAVWLLLVVAVVLFFRFTRGAARPSSGRSPESPRHGGALRLVAGNLLVLLLLLWTAVVAAETYLRFVYDQTESHGITLTNWAWGKRHVFLNSRGFRDREWPTVKRDGVKRVACVGDSFTTGWGVRDVNDAWPGRLGTLLDARGRGRVEVRNYGKAGLDSLHEFQIMEAALRDDAVDRVVLGYCLNDTDDLLPPERWFLPTDAKPVPFLERTRSFLADFLWFHHQIDADPRVRGYFDYEKEAYDDPQVWGRQKMRFELMADACRKAGARLDVAVFPFFSAWGEPYAFASCHDQVVAAWKELGVEAIDLRDAYRGIAGPELVVNRFDAHPNERAHDLAARAILERCFR